MALTNIRNHPYAFERALQSSSDYSNNNLASKQQQRTTGYYFTWLVFMQVKWVPFDAGNQVKLEQTLGLGGTFVDIEDSHFPGVKRVRAFPKSNYISFLGVKYRLSRVMQPDAWIDTAPADAHPTHPHDQTLAYLPAPPFPSRSPPPPLVQLQATHNNSIHSNVQHYQYGTSSPLSTLPRSANPAPFYRPYHHRKSMVTPSLQSHVS